MTFLVNTSDATTDELSNFVGVVTDFGDDEDEEEDAEL